MMSRQSANEILATNLHTLMTTKGMVQTKLAQLSGIGQTTVSLYLNPERRQPSKSGKIPSAKVTEIEALARALDVTLAQILSPGLVAVSAPFPIADAANDEDHAPIRFVDAKASAGKGKIVFSDDVTKMLMFRRDWLSKNDAKPEDTLAFQVDGSSMVDMHIIDGAVVLANQKKTDPISKKVYVLWLDGQLYVKQLIKQKGLWYARSHNEAMAEEYPDIQIEPDDRIVGRAFWCGFGL